jgi:pimeloyl-ACP methyl ester carboxylesterase
MNSAPQGSWAESPVLFSAGGNDLFGVLTHPVGASPRGIGVVVITGGAYIASVNRNRLSVRLARRLAGEGFHVLRFDYHGVGESTGGIKTYRLDRPFVQDLEGATRWLASAGLQKVILVGSCFGARTILSTAESVKGLVGAVLISAPVRDFQMGDRIPTRFAREVGFLQMIRKAARPRVLRDLLAPQDREAYIQSRRLLSIVKRIVQLKATTLIGRLTGRRRRTADGDAMWISSKFVRPLRGLVNRKVPLLFLYGTEEDFYREFDRARQQEGPLQQILTAADGTLEVQTIEGVVHGFTTLNIQEAVLERAQAWIERLSSTAGPQPQSSGAEERR